MVAILPLLILLLVPALYGAIALGLGHLLLRYTLGKSFADEHLWISRILLVSWVVGTALAYIWLVEYVYEHASERAPVVIFCWIFGAWIAEWRRLTATMRTYMLELKNEQHDSPNTPPS